jgi:hypothetical protein
VCVCTCVCMCVHACVCACACMSVCMCVCVHVCVCVCVCIYINILKQPYSSTTSFTTQRLDMQLLVTARSLGLLEPFTQSANVSSETLHTTKRSDKCQQLCVRSLSSPHESSLIQSIKQHSIVFQKVLQVYSIPTSCGSMPDDSMAVITG